LSEAILTSPRHSHSKNIKESRLTAKNRCIGVAALFMAVKPIMFVYLFVYWQFFLGNTFENPAVGFASLVNGVFPLYPKLQL